MTADPLGHPVQSLRPLSSGILLLACIALGGIIVLELSGDLSLAPDVTAAAPAAPDVQEVVVEPFEPPPAGQFAVISERPLFVPSRRPFVPPPTVGPAAGPAEAAPEPLAAELIGVMLTGAERAALIQRAGSSTIERLKIGQSVDGWRIEEVESRRVLLRQGEREHVLDLRRD